MSNNKYSFVPFTYRIDRKLYKYFSNIDYAISSIQNRTIHLDDPETYNDPFDGVFLHTRYTDLSTEESYQKIITVLYKCIITATQAVPTPEHNSVLKAMLPFMLSINLEQMGCTAYPISTGVRLVYDSLDCTGFTFEDFCNTINIGYQHINPFVPLDCKITCFSEIHDSILMWSYYANNHKGVCIEYDLSRLDLSDSINQNIIQCLTKVQYSPLRADRLIGIDDTSYLHFLISKADVWSHEQEWRIVCESENDFLPFDCISGVYLGVKFKQKTPEYEKLLNAVNTHKALKVFKGKRNLDIYGIDFYETYDSRMTYMVQNKPN